MDSLVAHPSNPQQAKAVSIRDVSLSSTAVLTLCQFTAPGSLSYPNSAAELTPPSSEKNAMGDAKVNGVATPADTPLSLIHI